MEQVRAKFHVRQKTHHEWGNTVVELVAISASDVEEDKRFHKATPSGTLTMSIDNPPAEEFFELGKDYYLDFTKCVSQV